MRVDPENFAALLAPVPAAAFIDVLARTGFSPRAYVNNYGDLAARNWDDNQALYHFFYHGLTERRDAPVTLDPDALVELAGLPLHDAAFKARLLTALGSHLFDDAGSPANDAFAGRWPAAQALAEFGARPYFVAGDSHSHQWALTGTQGDAWLLPAHMLYTGASAQGLGNAASRSGYGALLRWAVEGIEALPGGGDVPFLLQFGQVDIEFVYHYRRIRDGKFAVDLDDYRGFGDLVADRYAAFLTGLFAPERRANVHLISVFPPVLSDAAWKQGYANGDIVARETDRTLAEISDGVRALQVADLRQRTGIHARFNDRLAEACLGHGFRWIDAFTPFLGADGTVDPVYAAPEAAGAEHHLDARRTCDVIERLIWEAIG
jgi:hypothetical protein